MSFRNSKTRNTTAAALAALVAALALGLPGLTSVYAVLPGGGTEGCTPGFWKNHLDAWPATIDLSPVKIVSVTTDTKMSEVFNSGAFTTLITITLNGQQITDPTLLQALNAEGGGQSALARHAAAAILNAASSPDPVDFNYNPWGVVNLYRSALTGTAENMENIKNILESENEKTAEGFCE